MSHVFINDIHLNVDFELFSAIEQEWLAYDIWHPKSPMNNRLPVGIYDRF